MKIVITGPESTGKSTLSDALVKEYNASLVGEYAREYLSNFCHPEPVEGQAKNEIGYSFDDVLVMAKEQLKREQNAQGEIVFLDTDLTVFSIWIKEKYNQEVGWIEEHLKNAKNKIFFLCDIDVEWEEDPLREHPGIKDRQRLFKMYKELLEKYDLTYHIVSGDIPSRIKKCKEIINISI